MPRDLVVQFISHACLKITGEFGTLVCDPWMLNQPVFNMSTWKFPAAVVPPEEVVRDVDYLFITHTHEDHFHIPSLDHFPRDVNVLLPSYANSARLRAHSSERTLREMGFYNIRRLDPWQTFLLGGNTPLVYIPSADTRWHDWENAGFVIEHHDCVLMNMNDNLTDVPMCRKIAGRWPTIDIAFIQSLGVSMFPGCFRMSEAEMRAAAAERQVGMADQRRMLDWVKPKRIVPFAGDFCWLDDAHFHKNWANRGTPKLFEGLLAREYADRAPELITMLPSDIWSPRIGHEKRHPPINWDDYLEEIRRVGAVMRPRVEAIRSYIEAAPRDDLEARTKALTERVERYIVRDSIDFSGRFRISVEGGASFSFCLIANPEDGFRIVWGDNDPVDQILHVSEAVWAAIVNGRIRWSLLQWVAEAEQPVPYRPEMGRFFFWLEYYVEDLNPTAPQVHLGGKMHPDRQIGVDPKKGVFDIENEWDLAWLKGG